MDIEWLRKQRQQVYDQMDADLKVCLPDDRDKLKKRYMDRIRKLDQLVNHHMRFK